MKETFRERFSSYSTANLLVALHKKEHYNPIAIEVMEDIIQSRIISDEDRSEAEAIISKEVEEHATKQQKAEDIKNRFIDFFEPIIYPTREVDIKKWFNLFMLVLAIDTLYQSYRFCQGLYFFVNDSTYITFLSIQAIGPIAGAIEFYLAYKHLKAGWILMVFSNYFVIIYSVTLYFLFTDDASIFEFFTRFLFSLLLNVAFLLFLHKQACHELFGIDTPKKEMLTKRILLCCLGLMLPYVVIKLSQLGII
jgi:hypothetical protein